MFKKDKFIYGLIGGLLLPALAWSYEGCITDSANHKNIIFFISIGLNLLIIRLAYKKELTQTANGLMLTSFLAAMALFYFKLRS